MFLYYCFLSPGDDLQAGDRFLLNVDRDRILTPEWNTSYSVTEEEAVQGQFNGKMHVLGNFLGTFTLFLFYQETNFRL